jgi:hypothetical protein
MALGLSFAGVALVAAEGATKRPCAHAGCENRQRAGCAAAAHAPMPCRLAECGDVNLRARSPPGAQKHL